MTSKQIGMALTAVAVAAGVVSVADPALVPDVVRGWSSLVGAIVAAVGGALGFNTGKPMPSGERPPMAQRRDL